MNPIAHPSQPRLLDRVRAACRVRHHSLRTENSLDPRSGIKRRHHAREGAVGRESTRAVRRSGIHKRATSHSFATHLLVAGGAAGGLVGFKAGALTGGAIGAFFGPAGTAIGAGIGGTIGAIGGGVGGGYAGAHFAGRGIEGLYRFQDAAQQEEYAQFLLRHYQSR